MYFEKEVTESELKANKEKRAARKEAKASEEAIKLGLPEPTMTEKLTKAKDTMIEKVTETKEAIAKQAEETKNAISTKLFGEELHHDKKTHNHRHPHHHHSHEDEILDTDDVANASTCFIMIGDVNNMKKQE